MPHNAKGCIDRGPNAEEAPPLAGTAFWFDFVTLLFPFSASFAARIRAEGCSP